MAIFIEAAKLPEPLLWVTAQESEAATADGLVGQSVVGELADVLVLCSSMADCMEVDIACAVVAKLAANGAKYPLKLARGSAQKYTASSSATHANPSEPSA